MKFEIGEIVEIKHGDCNAGKKAVLLQLNVDKLFSNSELVKIMLLGENKPSYTLSDRISKI